MITLKSPTSYKRSICTHHLAVHHETSITIQLWSVTAGKSIDAPDDVCAETQQVFAYRWASSVSTQKVILTHLLMFLLSFDKSSLIVELDTRHFIHVMLLRVLQSGRILLLDIHTELHISLPRILKYATDQIWEESLQQSCSILLLNIHTKRYTWSPHLLLWFSRWTARSLPSANAQNSAPRKAEKRCMHHGLIFCTNDADKSLLQERGILMRDI